MRYAYTHPENGTNINTSEKYPYAQVSHIINQAYKDDIPPSSKYSPYHRYYVYARYKGWLQQIKEDRNAGQALPVVELSKLKDEQVVQFERLRKAFIAKMQKGISPNHPDNDHLWRSASSHHVKVELKQTFHLSTRHKYNASLAEPLPDKYRKALTQAMVTLDTRMKQGISPTDPVNENVWRQASHFGYINHLKKQYYLMLTHKTQSPRYTRIEVKEKLAEALQQGYLLSDVKSPFQKYYQYASRQGWLKQLRQELNLQPASRS